MAHGSAEITIECPATEVLDFVMDLSRYREVDDKLGTIHWIRTTDGGRTVLVRFTPRIMGLPGPRTTQQVVRGDAGIDISGVPAWTDALMTFRASFTCTEVSGGTQVVRALDFAFRRPFAWALDPIFNRWLARAVPEELDAAKEPSR